MGTVKKLYVTEDPVRIVSVSAPEVKHLHNYKLCFPSAEGLHILSWQDISHCNAEDNYCRIHLVNGKQIFLVKTLRVIQQFLPGYAFVRIHRSHLVRIDSIIRVHRDGVELREGRRLPVSRERYKEIVIRLQKITVMIN